MFSILLVGLSLLGRFSYAANPYANSEAIFIAKRAGDRPASDLVCNGTAINSHQAAQFSKDLNHPCHDLSLLNPEASPQFAAGFGANPDQILSVWNDVSLPGAGNALGAAVGSDDLPFDSEAEIQYVNTVPSRGGNFRMVGSQGSAISRRFELLMSKTAHNILLRKGLLRKLGYYVPAVRHYPQVKVRFDNALEKELFVKDLGIQTFSDQNATRWVVQSPYNSEVTLVLQDVLVWEAHHPRFNLENGFFPADLIENRRVFNSLVVPYSMVEIPESINGLAFHAGRVVSNQVRLSYPDADQFSCTYDDARWIVRRILALSRNDFTEIVAGANYPDAVATVLVEKLIARRNSLKVLFDLPGTDLDVDPEVSQEPDLVNGKVVRENWPGYAQRFSFGDPTSPFSSIEIFRYFESRAIGLAIDAGIDYFNQNVIKGYDITAAHDQHAIDLLAASLAEYLKTGKMGAFHTHVWSTPFWDGGLTFSRNVVIGSYLGTDNLIQLADSIGYSVSAGGFFALETTKLPAGMGVTGRLEAVVSRVYTHVKPIATMKEALKYPFKNLFVRSLERRHAGLLQKIDSGELGKLPEAERSKQLTELMTTFQENFGVGESIIVTNLAATDASVGMSLPVVQAVPLLTGEVDVSAGYKIISRLHIYRASEKLVQIYKDFGQGAQYSVSAGVSLVAPIISFSLAGQKGSIRTHLYPLNLDTDLAKNPEFFDNISSLSRVLKHDSLMPITSKQKPYVFKNRFSQKRGGLSLLYRQYDRLYSNQDFTVTTPDGSQKKIVRWQYATRKGSDFERMLTQTANSSLAILLKGQSTSFGIHDSGGDDPGNTFFGSSYSRAVTIDAEVGQDENADEPSLLIDPVVSISYKWKGWKAYSQKLLNLVDMINEKFDFVFFQPTQIQNIQAIGFYSLDVNTLIYQSGIEYAMTLSDEKFNALINKHWIPRFLQRYPPERIFRHFAKLRENYLEGLASGNAKYAASEAERFFADCDAYFSLAGLKEIVGGEQNLYAYSKLNGFKKGVEDGDVPYISDSSGEIGSSSPLGAVSKVVEKTNALEGEFLGSWLVWRLQ